MPTMSRAPDRETSPEPGDQQLSNGSARNASSKSSRKTQGPTASNGTRAGKARVTTRIAAGKKLDTTASGQADNTTNGTFTAASSASAVGTQSSQATAEADDAQSKQRSELMERLIRMGNEVAEIPPAAWSEMIRVAPVDEVAEMKDIRRKAKNRFSAKRSSAKRLNEAAVQWHSFETLKGDLQTLTKENFDLRYSLSVASMRIVQLEQMLQNAMQESNRKVSSSASSSTNASSFDQQMSTDSSTSDSKSGSSLSGDSGTDSAPSPSGEVNDSSKTSKQNSNSIATASAKPSSDPSTSSASSSNSQPLTPGGKQDLNRDRERHKREREREQKRTRRERVKSSSSHKSRSREKKSSKSSSESSSKRRKLKSSNSSSKHHNMDAPIQPHTSFGGMPGMQSVMGFPPVGGVSQTSHGPGMMYMPSPLYGSHMSMPQGDKYSADQTMQMPMTPMDFAGWSGRWSQMYQQP